jgi:hypothetical protein
MSFTESHDGSVIVFHSDKPARNEPARTSLTDEPNYDAIAAALMRARPAVERATPED